ncbi:MAG: ATP-binding protein [Defluviitaleaceae bacterium]|nr:ATP-binding protein [Defluviitaleaceae bacterium]
MGEARKVRLVGDFMSGLRLLIDYIVGDGVGLLLFFVAVLLLGVVVALLIVLARKGRKEAVRLREMADEYEEKLWRETATINAIVDSLSDVLFCKDLNLRYTRANKSFLELFELDNVVGKNDVEIGVGNDMSEVWNDADLKVLSERKTVRLDEVVPGKDGNRIFETIKTPMIHNGEVYGLLGLARDITERREGEKRLEEASRAKSEFLANMSHEIRTPMNSIVGFSELALEADVSPKTRNYLQKISENANWLLQIINDILDASKIESGDIVLEEVAFDLGQLTNQCKNLVLPTVLEKNLDFYVYVEALPEGKLLFGDAVRLRQVLVNIISNAVKFTHQGSVKVVSSLLAEHEGSVTMYIEISDTGIGMTQEQIDRVYEPFMQADSSATREHGGVGLGLPIVNGILEIMGSGLNIRSEVGEGTSISFAITLQTVDGADVEEQVMPMTSKKPYFVGHVLVCEDNEMNQMLISDHLQRVGLACTIARNGQEGVEMVLNNAIAHENPFDLILMDIHMPVMDGIEATRRIIASGYETPIVALTANVMSENVESYEEAGMVGHLGKPFTTQELWSMLHKHFTPIDDRKEDIECLLQDGVLASNAEQDEDARLVKGLTVSFVKDNKDFYDKLEEALRNGDTTLAYRLAHTLKSSAGILGKTHLQQVAVELESSLRADARSGQNVKEVSSATMRKLQMELDAVLEELEPVYEEEVSRTDVDGQAMPLSPEEIKELIGELEVLLKSRNAGSVNLISKLKSLPDSEELVELIDAFAFKDALATLQQLKEGWTTM